MSEEKTELNKKRLAVIRIRGITGIKKSIKDTLKMLCIYHNNYCVVVDDSLLGMIKKAKDYVTWGEIDDETYKLLVEKRGEEFIIITAGSNMKKILELDWVDETRTISNDIIEVSEVLGIEAARSLVVSELKKVLDDNGIAVDVRHIMLLGDLMTFGGNIKGIVRTGINKLKASPFARASFEETTKHLLDAAFKGHKETLTGVVENLIVGQPVKVGTGIVELLMK